MKAVYTARHKSHDVTNETFLGQSISAHEVVARAERIRDALVADGGFELVEPTGHGLGPILDVHDEGLVRFLEAVAPAMAERPSPAPSVIADTYRVRAMFEGMSEESIAAIPEPDDLAGRAGYWGLDTANPIVAGTYSAARAAVDVALTTLDLVLGGERIAYGLCRPPGHHAARSMAGGYCFFNNAAIAAEAFTRATGEATAVLDLDFHHGNGTQQLFWRRGDVFYASLHGDPRRIYPFFLGYATETGEGAGAGANLNIPLPTATGDEAYLGALDRALAAIDARPGSLVVVSLGFDTYKDDPICDFALTTAVYEEVGRRVAALGRRLVVLQEGGYHIESLGPNAVSWLRGAASGRREADPGSGRTMPAS